MIVIGLTDGPDPRIRRAGTPETRRIQRIIAAAVAEQGPVARDQLSAALDVMCALDRAGLDIVPHTLVSTLRPRS